jgi:ornithine cyclodeaminase/alanine dehydrogenase-like protein (mu-crystallin family)
MAGLKLVGGHADNLPQRLPFIRANLLLTDPRTGFLRALAAGDWISDLRTGAQPAGYAARNTAFTRDPIPESSVIPSVTFPTGSTPDAARGRSSVLAGVGPKKMHSALPGPQ